MLEELERGKVRLAFQIRCFKCGQEAHIEYNRGGSYYSPNRTGGWTWSYATHWICPKCSAKPSLNPDALKELIKAANRIARYPFLRYEPIKEQHYCLMCGSRGSKGSADESKHADNCMWRLLREALANLDNDGYVAQEKS